MSPSIIYPPPVIYVFAGGWVSKNQTHRGTVLLLAGRGEFLEKYHENDNHEILVENDAIRERFWKIFDPIKDEIREYMNYPRWASETEYLYYELLKYQETHPEFKT